MLAFDAMSSKVANYYFGVSASEANLLRPTYQSGKATTTSVGLSGTYKLNQRHSLMFGAIVTHLPGGVAASPIVETRRAETWYVGYGWNL